jgi:COP9 signalosome complex subunit 7
MDATADLTDGAALQQFIHLGKKTKGKATALIIQQALSAPNVFVFGEMLEMPNVQELAQTEDAKYLELLKIFAYGSFADYKAGSFPQLTPAQIKKLKQLTIVSLAQQSKVIPYDVLQKQLEIAELRELEDLIIESIYQGIIQGQLDQRNRQLEVEHALGRDLKPNAIGSMIEILTSWSAQSDDLLRQVKEKISHANFLTEQDKRHKEEFDKTVENVKSTLKAALEADMMQQAEYLDGGSEFGESDRNRKGGRGKLKGSGREHPMSGMNRRQNL